MNRFFNVALIVLLPLLFATAAYFKVPSARNWVDVRFPQLQVLIKKNAPTIGEVPAPVADDDSLVPDAPPSAVNAAPEPQERNSRATPPATIVSVDLQELSQSKEEWPKSITLKKAVTFPAVVNGKVSGEVKAPAGSMVNLILIRDGLLGVEFRGGGAMIAPGDTDLANRVVAKRAAASLSAQH